MLRILRDAVIIWALTAVIGFIVGATVAAGGHNQAALMHGLAVGNAIVLPVSFGIVGALKKSNRFPHLLAVAMVVWLTGLFNVFAYQTPAIDWLWSLGWLLAAMVVGGAISYLFVGAPRERQPADNTPAFESDPLRPVPVGHVASDAANLQHTLAGQSQTKSS